MSPHDALRKSEPTRMIYAAIWMSAISDDVPVAKANRARSWWRRVGKRYLNLTGRFLLD